MDGAERLAGVYRKYGVEITPEEAIRRVTYAERSGRIRGIIRTPEQQIDAAISDTERMFAEIRMRRRLLGYGRIITAALAAISLFLWPLWNMYGAMAASGLFIAIHAWSWIPEPHPKDICAMGAGINREQVGRID